MHFLTNLVTDSVFTKSAKYTTLCKLYDGRLDICGSNGEITRTVFLLLSVT